MICPILNPIRFYDVGNLPDYSTVHPCWDNQTQRYEWVQGLNPSPFYKEFLANATVNLQLAQETTESTVLTIYKYNEYLKTFETDGTISATDITPIGWVGNSIFSYSKAFTEGVYYLSLADGLTSDIFTVVSDTELKKRLVKVAYSHRENDYGCIFDNDYTFTNYFDGQLIIGEPENEIESFESDRGEMIKLQSTPKRIYTLNINDVHLTYLDHINLLFSLSEISVNGIDIENVEAISTEKSEFADTANVTVKLFVKNYDYYYKR